MPDFFLKIDGVDGESKDEEHSGEIDIVSFSYGVSQPSSAHSGGGSGVSKASFSDFTVMKQVDKTTPVLMKKCAGGDHFATVVFTARRAGGEKVTYQTITLSNAMITSYQKSGSDGGSLPHESVSFSYDKIEDVYTPQTEEGGADAQVLGTVDIMGGTIS